MTDLRPLMTVGPGVPVCRVAAAQPRYTGTFCQRLDSPWFVIGVGPIFR